MTDDTLELTTDDRGHDFAHSESTKHHRGDVSDDDFETKSHV